MGCETCDKKKNNLISIILKCVFIPPAISLLLFVIMTLVVFFLGMFDVTLPEVIEKGLFPILQLGLPILILLFGWVIVMFIELYKNKK